MSPRPPLQHVSDNTLMNSHPLREFATSNAAFGVSTTNKTNILLSQFRLSVMFASRLTLLLTLVMLVVGMRAEEKMIRAHAGLSIAVMTDTRSIWDRTVFKAVGDSMSGLIVTGGEKLSVTPCVDARLPKPAIRGLLHFRPETDNLFLGHHVVMPKRGGEGQS